MEESMEVIDESTILADSRQWPDFSLDSRFFAAPLFPVSSFQQMALAVRVW